ncbi:hypothetical protein [Halorubrum spindle-shaped virus-BLv25]|nr:hypothetical protein [Halorubrum spindle-shaped virus-BLv25]
MRIRDTNRRTRELENLKEATGEATKSGAIDVAVRFYLEMGRVDYGHSVGAFNELMETATEQGSLTAPEIAAILDSEYLPLEASASYSVGSK